MGKEPLIFWIPEPIVDIILSYVYDPSICLRKNPSFQQCAQVCKSWKDVCYRDTTMRHRCKKKQTLCAYHDKQIIRCHKTIHQSLRVGSTTFFIHEQEDLKLKNIEESIETFNCFYNNSIHLRVAFTCCEDMPSCGVCILVERKTITQEPRPQPSYIVVNN